MRQIQTQVDCHSRLYEDDSTIRIRPNWEAGCAVLAIGFACVFVCGSIFLTLWLTGRPIWFAAVPVLIVIPLGSIIAFRCKWKNQIGDYDLVIDRSSGFVRVPVGRGEVFPIESVQRLDVNETANGRVFFITFEVDDVPFESTQYTRSSSSHADRYSVGFEEIDGGLFERMVAKLNCELEYEVSG